MNNRIIKIINNIIEQRFFRPISIIIIIFFVAVNLSPYFFNINTKKNTNSNHSNIDNYNVIFNEQNIKFDFSQDQIHSHIVKMGDTILKILLDIGASENQAFNMLESVKKIFDPRSIRVGNEVIIKYGLRVNYDPNNSVKIDRSLNIKSLTINLTDDEKIIITNDGSSYSAKKHKVKLVKAIERYYGEIKSGLYLDGISTGLSSNSVMNMINLYSYDIDFQRDIRIGDKFEVIVEVFYDPEGIRIRDGNILLSSITTRGKTITMYLHEYKNSFEYFNKEGNSIKKSLLRTPVNGARISSRYGMRRHPVLGYSKMHKGIDFAAPTGTPIFAAGSGKITHRGRRGAYGNYLRIKHNSQYSTAYAHISRFNKKFKRGSRVKQGDVIAYVGSTGRSTGPHLHFEVLKNGIHINPSKVKASSGIRLKGKDYKNFVKTRNLIQGYRSNLPNQIYLQ